MTAPIRPGTLCMVVNLPGWFTDARLRNGTIVTAVEFIAANTPWRNNGRLRYCVQDVWLCSKDPAAAPGRPYTAIALAPRYLVPLTDPPEPAGQAQPAATGQPVRSAA